MRATELNCSLRVRGSVTRLSINDNFSSEERGEAEREMELT